MNILAITQSLFPRIDIIRALQDRERNSELGKFLIDDQLEHLKEHHQFKALKNEMKRGKRWSALKEYNNSALGFIKYYWEILKVISWVLQSSSYLQPYKQEYVLLKGLGFQQINPHFPADEIYNSIPIEVFQSQHRDDIFFILISQLPVQPTNGWVFKKDVFQSLLLTQKPHILRIFRFLFQAGFFGFLALFNSQIRKLLREIPSALLIMNFDPKSKFLSLVDTQGSFEKLDLIYYVDNEKSKVRSTMLHYSEGGMPFTKVQVQNSLFVHKYELAPIDSHIVWTSEYAEYFNSRTTKSNFKALGPQVLRSNTCQVGPSNSYLFRVAVFDETPSLMDEPYEHMREEAGLEFLEAVQHLHHYFNSQNQSRIVISLKQKRRNREFHSKAYLEKLENLSTNRVIDLLPWFTNPFEVVANSDAVLTVLGASPALIGRHLALPTAYGYFGSLELGQPLINYKIPILTRRDDLVHWIESLKTSQAQ